MNNDMESPAYIRKPCDIMLLQHILMTVIFTNSKHGLQWHWGCLWGLPYPTRHQCRSVVQLVAGSASCLHQVQHLHARLTQQIEEDAMKKNIPCKMNIWKQKKTHEHRIQQLSTCPNNMSRKAMHTLNSKRTCSMHVVVIQALSTHYTGSPSSLSFDRPLSSSIWHWPEISPVISARRRQYFPDWWSETHPDSKCAEAKPRQNTAEPKAPGAVASDGCCVAADDYCKSCRSSECHKGYCYGKMVSPLQSQTFIFWFTLYNRITRLQF